MSSVFGQQSQQPKQPLQENRFSNLQINYPQQQQQQQQQQNNTQSLAQTSTSNGKEESWYNIARKRNIPQTVIKRPSKPTSSGDNSSTDTSTHRSGFSSVQFGTKNPTFNSSQPSQPTDIATYVESNEAPPTKSLYDWQREDEFGSVSTNMSLPETSHQINLSQRFPKNSRNAFDRNSEATHTRVGKDEINDSSRPKSEESAVIVFGYPESISNQVILHFSKFGNILEDFEILRGVTGNNISSATIRLRTQNKDSKAQKKYPIFTGDGWIKITYDSPSAALRALQENGTVYGGCLIGCVPYNKAAVEQLASCKIDKSDDIGNIPFSLSMKPNGSSSADAQNRSEDDNDSRKHGSRFSFSTRKLDVKDGKELFVHNGNSSHSGQNFLKSLENKLKEQEQQGGNQQPTDIVGKLNNWLFGWNDL